MPTDPETPSDLDRLRKRWGARGAEPGLPAVAPPAALPDAAALLGNLTATIAASLGPDTKEFAIAAKLLENGLDTKASSLDEQTIAQLVETLFPQAGELLAPKERAKVRDRMAKALDDLEDVLQALKLGVEVQKRAASEEAG